MSKARPKDSSEEEVKESKEEVSPDAKVLMFRKSAGIALILSLIIPGVGQMYVGKVRRGVKILIPVFAIFIIGPTVAGLLLASTFTSDPDTEPIPFATAQLALRVATLLFIPGIILWIWQVIDSYRNANRYNEALLKLKRRPSKSEF
ncbi:MAG: DUF6677 family protein [Nitrososphaerales archaeon]